MSNIFLIVKRFSDNGVETCSNIAVMHEEQVLFECVGLELPWKNNEHQISCIPATVYNCEKVKATANIPYEHISITNVDGRSGVCIHKANYVRQLKGCICVGDKHTDINGDKQVDVTNSGKTFDKLMSILPDKFKLIIN